MSRYVIILLKGRDLMIKKYLNVLYTIVVSIFLWILCDKILGPNWDHIVNSIINFFASISTPFSNAIYHSISYGFHESFGLTFYLVFYSVGIIVAIVWYYHFTCYTNELMNDYNSISSINKLEAVSDKLISLLSKDGITGEEINEIKQELDTISVTDKSSNKDSVLKKPNVRLRRVASTALLVTLIFLYGYIMVTSTFINSCQTSTLHTIEVVSPYVSDTEYKQFKSDFYLIRNKHDYDALQLKLKTIAKKHNINLE